MSGTKGYDEGVFLMLSPHLYVAALLDVTSKLALCLRKHFVLCVQMLLDPMGGIVMTNDGNAILREVINP